MTIFVDEMREYKSGDWCHMWTDEADTVLDKFAKRIGLKKAWSHTSNGISGRFYHYDLRLPKREEAIQNGAIVKPLREWIKQQIEARARDEFERREFDEDTKGIMPNVPDDNCPKRSCPIMYGQNYVVCTQCGRNPAPKLNRLD